MKMALLHRGRRALGRAAARFPQVLHVITDYYSSEYCSVKMNGPTPFVKVIIGHKIFYKSKTSTFLVGFTRGLGKSLSVQSPLQDIEFHSLSRGY